MAIANCDGSLFGQKGRHGLLVEVAVVRPPRDVRLPAKNIIFILEDSLLVTLREASSGLYTPQWPPYVRT